MIFQPPAESAKKIYFLSMFYPTLCCLDCWFGYFMLTHMIHVVMDAVIAAADEEVSPSLSLSLFLFHSLTF